MALVFAMAATLYAAAPMITELEPRGAERGKAITLTIAGRDIPEGARISSTLSASFTPLVSSKPEALMNPGRYASFLMEPKADIAPGVYPIRLETPQGISNVLLFTIGNFPEKIEEESASGSKPNRNDTIESAEPVSSAPVVINGTLLGAERDLYRVHGKAAEKRVFEVEARRAGSAIDPFYGFWMAMASSSRGGRRSRCRLGCRLEFTFPREAYYYVEVRRALQPPNAKFLSSQDGRCEYPEAVFPLGGRRGEIVNVTYFGGNLATAVKSSVDLRQIPEALNLATPRRFSSPW
ncbi:MAG: hypothetical protein WKF37_13600 [Bryobacteraceae bacterium]